MQLALPSRDYYLKTSSEGDMEAYHKYMTQVAILLGANATLAKEDLRDVVEFERRLANVSENLYCIFNFSHAFFIIYNNF